MHLATTTLALFAVLAASSCSTFGAPGHRTGPAFREAFPDPTVLVTTAEPEVVRRRLAKVQLPAEYPHHDQLVALLRSQERITAAHLLLLVEAVALPEGGSSIDTGTRARVYAPRGEGQFASYADQLLSEGSAKLETPDLASLGELLARSQRDPAMQTLADRFVPPLDDGSTSALQQLLGAMQGSPALVPFLTNYMLERGRLEGERGWTAFALLSFDAERVELVRAIASRTKSFEPARIAALTKAMSFDEGRKQIVRILAGKVRPVPPDTARAVVATFAFDEGRSQACTMLASQSGLLLDFRQLTSIARLFSFDDSRTTAVRSLVPCLKADGTGGEAQALLGSFSFDEGRLAALRMIRSKLAPLSDTGRRKVLSMLSFSSSREAAAGMLQE